MEKLNIRFGAMVPPLAEQIGEILNVDTYQKDADAVVRLYLRGVITDTEKQNANKRLFKMIEQQILKEDEDDVLTDENAKYMVEYPTYDGKPADIDPVFVAVLCANQEGPKGATTPQDFPAGVNGASAPVDDV